MEELDLDAFLRFHGDDLYSSSSDDDDEQAAAARRRTVDELLHSSSSSSSSLSPPSPSRIALLVSDPQPKEEIPIPQGHDQRSGRDEEQEEESTSSIVCWSRRSREVPSSVSLSSLGLRSYYNSTASSSSSSRFLPPLFGSVRPNPKPGAALAAAAAASRSIPTPHAAAIKSRRAGSGSLQKVLEEPAVDLEEVVGSGGLDGLELSEATASKAEVVAVSEELRSEEVSRVVPLVVVDVEVPKSEKDDFDKSTPDGEISSQMLTFGFHGEKSQSPATSMCFNQQGQDSQVTRQFKAVTGDSKGLVSLHTFSVVPLLNRFSVKTQCLLDGQKTGTVLSASPLLMDETYGFGYTSAQGNSATAGGLGSMVGGVVGGVVGGEAGWKLFNEGSSVVEEGVVIFVTHQNALVVRLSPNVEVYEKFPRPDGMLVVLTLRGQLCLFAKNGNELHRTSFIVDEKAYHNAVCRAGDWMGALDMSMRLYDGHAHGVIDLPRTVDFAFCNQTEKVGWMEGPKIRHSSMRTEVEEQYARVGGVAVEFCVHIKRTDILFDSIFSKFVAVQHGGTFLEILEPYILRDMLGCLPPEIMQALVEHYSGKGWLQRVEQCVLHMDISSLDFNQVVRYKMLVYLKYCFQGLAFPPGHEATLDVLRCSFTQEEPKKIDGCSTDLPESNIEHGKEIDFESQDYQNVMDLASQKEKQVLTLLKVVPQTDWKYDDVLHLCMKANFYQACGLIHAIMGQYIAALDSYMRDFNEPVHAFVFINKMLVQLKNTDASSFRSSVISRIPELVKLSRECTFFLVIDQFSSERHEATLDVLRCSFTQEEPKKIDGCSTDLPESNIEHGKEIDFESQDYQNVMDLASQKEKQVLTLLKVVPQTDWKYDDVLHLCMKANFYQACGLIHAIMGQYIAALDSYMRDFNEPVHAFVFINKMLVQLKNTDASSFRSSVISRIPELVKLSRECTFFLVIDQFSSETYMERLSNFPKPLQHNAIYVTDELAELYLELLCQFERNSVLKFLETFDSYRVGDVGNALTLIMTGLKEKIDFLVAAVENSSEIVSSNINEMEQLLYVLQINEVVSVHDVLHTSIGLCQRNTQRLDPQESESLWFWLLDS
ncbi:hypothetical protein COCNU_04G007990 [Cocos nucifera]|uniref:Vacuolar protein sorting-associated protein 8 central domain-containing protein n=1 Tax=Cocos nucifera TaxID=13894 RepID=A0A8K0N098_COCNU|nr:hypothetical protein COCNU_04G007990 [Cocos nucifera]